MLEMVPKWMRMKTILFVATFMGIEPILIVIYYQFISKYSFYLEFASLVLGTFMVVLVAAWLPESP